MRPSRFRSRNTGSSAMLSYIIRRLLLMFPTLLGITALVFFVMGLAPGGIGGSRCGQPRTSTRRAGRSGSITTNGIGIDNPLVGTICPLVQSDFADRAGVESEMWNAGELRSANLRAWASARSRAGRLSDSDRRCLAAHATAEVIAACRSCTHVGILSGMNRGTGGRGSCGHRLRRGVLLGEMVRCPTIWAGRHADRSASPIGRNIQLVSNRGLHETVAAPWPFSRRSAAHGFPVDRCSIRAWHLVLPEICLCYGGVRFPHQADPGIDAGKSSIRLCPHRRRQGRRPSEAFCIAMCWATAAWR